MFTPKIKTYTPGMQLPAHHFFVLSKGFNSGRPSATPNANCFIVSAASGVERDNLYWLSFALWQGRGFHYMLRGSVIPFIIIKDYQKVLLAAQQQICPARLQKLVAWMQLLQQKEENARVMIKQTQQLRNALLLKNIKV